MATKKNITKKKQKKNIKKYNFKYLYGLNQAVHLDYVPSQYYFALFVQF